MNNLFISGWGAVSPAGWNTAALREALARGEPLPIQPLERPGWTKPLRARLVPKPAAPPAFLAHARLRRTSPITHYTVAAAFEALAGFRARHPGPARFGVVLCLQSGCVQYTHRFFKEVLEDPATASPLLFPETVFAAPASHLAAVLGNVALVYTLIGDPACYPQGLALGADWLAEDRVDACVVIGAEEVNWLRADALWHLDHPAVISGGAGALCLCRKRIAGAVRLEAITQPFTFTTRQDRLQAARAMRAQLGPARAQELLCDGLGDSPRTDAPEMKVWSDWPGARVSPKRILGEGLMAAAAWQCVAACDAVAGGQHPAATVSLVGCNQQAIAVRLAAA